MQSEIQELTQAVLAGEASALEAYTTLTEIKKEIEKQISEIKDLAIAQAQQYGKNFVLNNYEYTLVDGRAMYDFKCVPQWVEKQKELKEIEEKAKQAAINAQKNITLVSDDGEIVTPCIIKYSEPYLTIKANGK